MDLKGRYVRFAIRDIYFPPPETVLFELHGDNVMSGTVVDISDSGAAEAAFVVVRVDSLATPVVVAVDRIRGEE